MQPAGGVEDDDVVAVVLGVAQGFFGDLHRVALTHLKDRDPGLFAHHLQLFDGRRAVDVAGHQQRAVPLAFEQFAQLARVGGFARALQAAHHDDAGRLGGDVQPADLPPHEGDELLVDDLDDLLGGGQTLKDGGAHRPLGHRVHKLLGDLVVDVRLQQGQADLPHGGLDVLLPQLALLL